MSHEVVIARYAEDLSWICEIPAEFKVIVYNKGQPLNGAPYDRAQQTIDLPNVGRESDTFLRHIANKRDFDDGFTVFLQGDPFEHSPDILSLLRAWDAWDDVQPLSWRWLANEKRPPKSILDREKNAYIGDARVRAEVFSLTTWTPLQFFDAGSRWLEDEYRRIHELPQGINIAAHFLRRCEWLELAERAEQHMSGRFSYGALFAVKQNLLRAFPQRSLSLAIGAAGAHSTYGYVIERLWLHMCGAPFLHFAPNSAPDNKQAEQAGPQLWPVPAPSQPPRSRRIMPGLKKRVLAWAMT